MKNALELNIRGIKCDNPNCDFKDMDVKVEEYKEWLNKPCPKCGENLLTKKDYRNVKFLLRITKLINSVCPKCKDNKEVVKARVEMDGTGKMDLKIQD